jgi:molecular chaperone DnaK (HSP70)
VLAGDLAAVEVIGGSVRIPAVKTLLQEAFGRDLSTTLNSEECIARGCAWQCAMLSPVFRMKPFKVVDVNPFAVSVQWADAAMEPNTVAEGASEPKLLFTKQQAIPSTKMITIPRRESLVITAFYSEPADLVSGVPTTIGRFEVVGLRDAYEKADAEDLVDEPKLQVRVRMDSSGVVSLTGAHLVKLVQPAKGEPAVKGAEKAAKTAPAKKEEPAKEPEAEPKKQEEGAEETTEAMDTTTDEDTAGKSDADREKKTEEDAQQKANAAPAAAADAKKKPEEPPKPRQVKVTLQVREDIVDTLTDAELKAAAQHELDMVARDAQIRATVEARNQLESYVYDFRAKISYESLGDFVEEAPKTDFLRKLQTMEDWLYTEEADTCSQEVFEDKYAGLKAVGDEIVLRQREHEARPAAITALTTAVSGCTALVESDDVKLMHIVEEERNKARTITAETQKWLEDINTLLATYQKTQNPVVLVADIAQRQQTMQKLVNDIMLKPAPTPVPEPTTKAAGKDDAAGKPEEGAAKSEESSPQAEVDPAATADLPVDGLDPAPVDPMDMD